MNNAETHSDHKESRAEPAENVTLDSVLKKEVGEFGKYQITNLLLLSFVTIFAGWNGNEYIFTTGRITTRCLIPECDAVNPSFQTDWIQLAVPNDSNGVSEQCVRFNATASTTSGNMCVPESFDNATQVPCEQFVYENTNTIVYDFDLGCDEWKRSTIGTYRVIGTLMSHPTTGFISDRWGRKPALILNAFSVAWVGLSRYWAPNYELFVFLEVFEAFIGGAGFACAFMIVTEMVGVNYRTISTATTHSLFSIGQITLALVAWYVPNWRNLTLALYIPQFLTILYIWLAPESVRWYLSKGRYEEAERGLKKIASVNRRQVSESTFEKLRLNSEETKRRSEQSSKSEPWLISLVFKHKPVLLICVISPVWWITTVFIFYGLLINAVNLTGNTYVNFMLVAAMEIPGYWIGALLMTKIGRKTVLAGAYWMCAACQIGFLFTVGGNTALSMVLYLLSKVVIAIVALTIYVYTAELYPTKYRHMLFGYSVATGRIASFIVPLTPALSLRVWEPLPFVLFAIMGILAGLLVLLAPETKDTKLPDTMEEASFIGKKKRTTKL